MPEDTRFFPTEFFFPTAADPPSTEVGVLLMGLEADRLLAGLGLSGPGDEAPAVTLRVDRIRHGPAPAMAAAVAAGARRWVAARAGLAVAGSGDPMPAALRTSWVRALAAVSAAVSAAAIGDPGPAGRSYLAACWLRRSEVDGYASGKLSISR